MLKNYFMLSIRNLQMYAGNSIVNLLSLSIGFSACILLYLFISNEYGFDSFHEKGDRIYRLYTEANYDGNRQEVAITNGWLGGFLSPDIPEIEKATRFWNKGKLVVNNGQELVMVENIAAVDSTFLNIFDFPMIEGSRNALDEPNTIILTEQTATRLFKDVSQATGKSIIVGDRELKITGVMAPIPGNSHLKFSALVSLPTYSKNDRMFETSWDGSFLNTYILLEPNADVANVERKLPDFLVRHSGVKDITKSVTLHAQALRDVHLGSTNIEHDYNNDHKFNGTYIRLLVGIGMAIIVIASINFVNLTLARTLQRRKEVGVRRSIGAARVQLFGQFTFECSFIALLSLIIALGLTSAFLPALNEGIDRTLHLSNIFTEPQVLLSILGATVAVGFIAGLYPALYVTSLKTVRALKHSDGSSRRNLLGGALVVVQFVLAIGMIIGTLLTSRQLKFMTTTDIGFNKKQIVLIDMNSEVNQKFQTLKTEWLRKKSILGVTASSQRIGNNFNGWGFKVRLDSGIYRFAPSNVNVDYDYLKVYEIELASGRDFSREIASDQGRAFIVNETMVKSLGLEDAVGLQSGHAWNEDTNLGTIIGVAKDFNYNSLHNEIGSLALVVHPEWGYEEISIRIDGNNIEQSLAEIKATWDATISTYPFNYSFLDDHFDTLYRSDSQMRWALSAVTGCAILIACIGLFGLAANLALTKVKEIGIRKTLGASSVQITVSMTSHFVKLVVLSFVLACPITYHLISMWLESFSYRIEIGVLTFIIGGLIAVAIAVLTISYHTVKSGFENPVKSLRYE